MFAPARMPVAEGKKMENMPKKLPPGPRQSGTKFAAKILAVKGKRVSLQESSAINYRKLHDRLTA